MDHYKLRSTSDPKQNVDQRKSSRALSDQGLIDSLLKQPATEVHIPQLVGDPFEGDFSEVDDEDDNMSDFTDDEFGVSGTFHSGQLSYQECRCPRCHWKDKYLDLKFKYEQLQQKADRMQSIVNTGHLSVEAMSCAGKLSIISEEKRKSKSHDKSCAKRKVTQKCVVLRSQSDGSVAKNLKKVDLKKRLARKTKQWKRKVRAKRNELIESQKNPKKKKH